MNCNWNEVYVGELGQVVTGKTPKTVVKEYYGGDVPFLTPSDDMDVKKVFYTAKTLTDSGVMSVYKCLIPENSICVSCIGSGLGKVVMTTRSTVTNQQINSIIPNKHFDPDFIYYAMCILGEKLNYISKTSTAVPIINKSSFSKFAVSVPHLAEQIAISKTLSALDDKIELNNRINKNLEEMAQAIFKRWFVDFEFPDENGNPYKSSGGEMVESEMGEIPKGWKVFVLDEIVSLSSGYSYKSSELKSSNVAMATIKNFKRAGGFEVKGFKEIDIDGKIKLSQYAQLFDVLVAHTDITQNADVIGNAEMLMTLGPYDKIIISLDLVKVEPKIPDLSNFLLASILRSPQFKNHALGYINGTTVLHLSKKAIPLYKIAMPINMSSLNNLNNLLETTYKIISCNITDNQHVLELRDVLLPRLMSGEIIVNDFYQ